MPFQYLFFVLGDVISGYLHFPGTLAVLPRGELPFSRMFLIHSPSSQAHSSQAGRHVLLAFFSRYFSTDIFSCSVIFPSNQTAFLAGHISGTSKHKPRGQSNGVVV